MIMQKNRLDFRNPQHAAGILLGLCGGCTVKIVIKQIVNVH